ncbi:hypothetical protein OXX79_003259 [Metschnikowia pulcherrima]
MEITLSHAANQVRLLTNYGGYMRRRSMRKAISRLKNPVTSTVNHIPHASETDSDCALRSAELDSDSEESISDQEELNMVLDGPEILVKESLFGIEGPASLTSEHTFVSDTPACKTHKPVGQKRVVSPGSSVYICKRSGHPKPKKTAEECQRARGSQKCGCKASYTIRFCEGYKHAPDGSLNVEEHGDDIVTVTWNYEHKHLSKGSGSPEEIQQLRRALRKSVAGDSNWRDYISQRTKWLFDSKKKNVPAEDLKIKHDHWFNESKRTLRNLALKDLDPEASLRLWAGEITKLKGMAAFTDKFDFREKCPALTSTKASRGGKIWSFCFMSEWQKVLLQQNCSIILLDSTRKTCRGLHEGENVYLFTLYVKNHVTRKGAPAAFMMTNCGRSEVISHFIRAVRKFAWFSPKKVIVDCDQEETNAFSDVWNDEISIIYCRRHVSKAFVNNARTNVTVGRDSRTARFEEKKKEIQDAFEAVVRSETKEEGEECIQDFLTNFADFPELIDYTARQWFANENFIVNGRAENVSTRASTNNLIKPFNNVLKRYFLENSSQDRPDLLVFKLFFNVEQNYRAEENLVKIGCADKVNDKNEKAAKAKALNTSEEELNKSVTFLPDGTLDVRSFPDEDVSFSVQLDFKYRQKVNCTCLAFEDSQSSCIHIFLGYIWWLNACCPKNQHTGSDSDLSIGELLDAYGTLDGVEDDEDVDDVLFGEIDTETPQRVREQEGLSRTVGSPTLTPSERLGDVNENELSSAASTPSPRELFSSKASGSKEVIESIFFEEPALDRFEDDWDPGKDVSKLLNGHSVSQIDVNHVNDIEKLKKDKTFANRRAHELKKLTSFMNAQSDSCVEEFCEELHKIYRKLDDRHTNKKQKR